MRGEKAAAQNLRAKPVLFGLVVDIRCRLWEVGLRGGGLLRRNRLFLYMVNVNNYCGDAAAALPFDLGRGIC